MTSVAPIIITGVVAVLLQAGVNDPNEAALDGIIEGGIGVGIGDNLNRGRFTEPAGNIEDEGKEANDYHRREVTFPCSFDAICDPLKHAIKMPHGVDLSRSNVTFRPPVRGEI